MKVIIKIVTALLLMCSVAFAKELVVGMELAYPPFEMTDKDGNPSGFSVDFAKELGKSLGRDVKIENIAWDGLIPALKTGKVDLIISSMTITDERRKSIDFSIPYSKSALALLINIKSDVKKFDDLNKKGKKVAVKKGTTAHIYAQKHIKDGEILVFDKESACVLEVTQGKADAFVYDQLTIFNNYQNHKTTTTMNLEPFQGDFEYWGAAIRQGNDELRAQVNRFIIDFQKNGGFNKLADKHLSEAKKVFDALGIPFFFDIKR